MHPQERWQHRRRRQRDYGLARVGSLTRAAIAAGVVASALLAAQVANLLPGQASASGSTKVRTSPAVAVQPGTSTTPAPHPRHRHPEGKTQPTLTPPAQPPRPTHTQPPVTSGGS